MTTTDPDPKDARRRLPAADTAAAIVSAALRLMEDDGWDAPTVASVAREAGVSVGSVYTRFGDKDGLVAATNAAFVARLRDATLAAPPPTGDLEQRVGQLVAAHCRLLEREQALVRSFMFRTVLDPRLTEAAAEGTRAMSRRFETGLADIADQVARPDLRRACAVCFRMVHDVTARRIARGGEFESDVELSWDLLIEELTRVCVAYLRRPR